MWTSHLLLWPFQSLSIIKQLLYYCCQKLMVMCYFQNQHNSYSNHSNPVKQDFCHIRWTGTTSKTCHRISPSSLEVAISHEWKTLATQTRPVICGDLTYELDGFFKVLFQILTATVRRLKTLAHQAVLKVERNVCGNVKYVSDSEFLQRLLVGGISFISFTE